MDRQERQLATAFARCHDSSPANATHSLAGQYPASQLSRSTIRHSLPAPHSVSCPTSRALKGHPFHRLAAAGGSLNLSSPAEPRTTACRRPLRRRRSARSTRGRRGLFDPTDNDARQQPALLAAGARRPVIGYTPPVSRSRRPHVAGRQHDHANWHARRTRERVYAEARNWARSIQPPPTARWESLATFRRFA